MRRLRRISLGIGGAATGMTALHLGDDYLPVQVGGIVRSARTAVVMARIAVDYKYSFWRYPGMSGLSPEAIYNAMEDGETLEEGDVALREVRSALHQRNANRLLWLLWRNRGLYVKVGQGISAANHVLPGEFTSTLRVLQDDAPKSSFEDVKATIEQELGRPLHELFDQFDETPLASASLAQVHIARCRDTGQKVAVKVQHPLLAQQFRGDMFVHKWVLWVADQLFEGFELSWSHDEIERGLAGELDFVREGRNGMRAKAHFANNPQMYVPTVLEQYTGKRVLTMEFIEGWKVTDVGMLKGQGFDMTRILQDTLIGISQQIFMHGFVHCDPHGGNVFVRQHPNKGRGQHQIVLLDHGLVRELDESTRVNYCRLWEGLVLQDDERVKAAAKSMGVNDWEVFATMTLMRPYRGSVGLAERSKLKDRKEVAKVFHEQRQRVFQLLKAMPRELLFVYRNQNYMRFLCKELGLGVNRYVIMARTAVKGLSHTPNPPLPGHELFQPEPVGWARAFWFEWGLISFRMANYVWDMFLQLTLQARPGAAKMLDEV